MHGATWIIFRNVVHTFSINRIQHTPIGFNKRNKKKRQIELIAGRPILSLNSSVSIKEMKYTDRHSPLLSPLTFKITPVVTIP